MEKTRLTLQERLYRRRIRKPPALVYWVLGYLWKALFIRKYNVHYRYLVDPRKLKGPYIVVSNHASRVDYLYTGVAFLPHRLNYVAGFNEFFRSHLRLVFHLLQVIPKKNFTPEVYSIREIARVLRLGGRVILFPEGMSSISGSNQPSAVGTGKLLKHFGLPVLMTHIEGGYLTNTKYCLEDRPGRVDVTVSRLFEPEDLAKMTENEIQLAVDRAIHHDDYEWNRTARVRFDGKGRLATALDTLLYRCPRCHAEFRMRGEGDAIRCEACGNAAVLNDCYDLLPATADAVVPTSPRAWFDEERAAVRAAILADPAFALSEKIVLAMLPKYEVLKNLKTAEPVGEGTLVLSRDGLVYTGTRDGAPWTFRIATDGLPTFGMCTDVTFFASYFEGEYVEFRPARPVTAKWLHAAEELHRINGGRWHDFPQPLENAIR